MVLNDALIHNFPRTAKMTRPAVKPEEKKTFNITDFRRIQRISRDKQKQQLENRETNKQKILTVTTAKLARLS